MPDKARQSQKKARKSQTKSEHIKNNKKSQKHQKKPEKVRKTEFFQNAKIIVLHFAISPTLKH